jgi:hypothetical protein
MILESRNKQEVILTFSSVTTTTKTEVQTSVKLDPNPLNTHGRNFIKHIN